MIEYFREQLYPWGKAICNELTKIVPMHMIDDRSNLMSVYFDSSKLVIVWLIDWQKAVTQYTPSDVKLRGSFQFACCGINGSSNYGTSWWRLQEVGRRELVVPLSCCTLNNVNQTDSFLNPEPANLTLCQALNPAEHQYARHTTVRIVNQDVVDYANGIGSKLDKHWDKR